ncbi:hypothetical protein V2J09_002357 [Rumex salicifolius]
MADNDVNISGGVNGDSVEFDDLAVKKTEAKEVFSGDHFLKARIKELEHEKRELAMEKDEMKAVLEKMEEEKLAAGKKMEAAEAERNELEMKAMQSITKRAFDLEGEVLRLQHDLGSAMNAGDEASREVERLMREVDELKKEKSALLEKVIAQVEELKRLESDSGSKIIDLENQIESLTESDRVARKEAAIAEEKAKARLNELEREITQVKKEKTAVEGRMASLDDELKSSEKKVIEMAKRIQELAEDAEANGKILDEMVEKAAERDAGNKVPLPLAGAVSAGVIVAAIAVCYVNYSRTR